MSLRRATIARTRVVKKPPPIPSQYRTLSAASLSKMPPPNSLEFIEQQPRWQALQPQSQTPAEVNAMKNIMQGKPTEGSKQIVESDGKPYEEHASEGSQYLRDIILGVNDGLISTFLLVFGVVGGGLDSEHALITGLAGAFAGALSMALGEYIATKSQLAVDRYDIGVTKEHIDHYRHREMHKLRLQLAKCNLHGDTLDQTLKTIGDNDQLLLKALMAFEMGAEDEEGNRNPLIAMSFSGGLFLTGASPSVIPFAIFSNATIGLVVAGSLCGVALFVVGACKTIATKGNLYRDGAENMLFGLVGAAASYGVGVAYSNIRNAM